MDASMIATEFVVDVESNIAQIRTHGFSISSVPLRGMLRNNSVRRRRASQQRELEEACGLPLRILAQDRPQTVHRRCVETLYKTLFGIQEAFQKLIGLIVYLLHIKIAVIRYCLDIIL